MSAAGRVVVVGGGIIGTMYCLMALEAGFEVVHVERDIEPRGASVRNFGLVWVGGRAAGPELALALRARRLWEEIALRVDGLHFRPAGPLTVAGSAAELRMMEQAARQDDAGIRQWQLLSAESARGLCPELSERSAGALYCGRDAVVEPRLAVNTLREHLRRQRGYSWASGREVVLLGERKVKDEHGEWFAGDRVLLCTGAQGVGLVAPHLGGPRVRRVRLQMLQTEPYPGTLGPALADCDSMRYYPAYDAGALAWLPPQAPIARSFAAQLLLVQRVDGCLTFGDTHDYDEPFPFDLEEEIYRYLLDRAAAVLRQPVPRVQRRWAGVYSETIEKRSELYWREEVLPGVEVVSGVGGRGMTCAPAIAEQSVAWLSGNTPAARPDAHLGLPERVSAGTASTTATEEP